MNITRLHQRVLLLLMFCLSLVLHEDNPAINGVFATSISDEILLRVMSMYMPFHDALTEYSNARKSQNKQEKERALIRHLSSLTNYLRQNIPEYLHDTLPYREFMNDPESYYFYSQRSDLPRPSTLAEIRQAADGWMCSCMQNRVIEFLDNKYSLEWIFADSNTHDQDLKKLEVSMLEKTEFLRFATRMHMVLSDSNPKILKMYDQLFDQCIAKPLKSFPK